MNRDPYWQARLRNKKRWDDYMAMARAKHEEAKTDKGGLCERVYAWFAGLPGWVARAGGFLFWSAVAVVFLRITVWPMWVVLYHVWLGDGKW